MRILPSRSMIWALISPIFELLRTSTGSLPSRICWRISGTHFGHSESVVRGQPSGGLVFSYDLSSGLSDHLGLGDGFCLIRFRRSNTAHAPVAATVTAFSTYFTGLCMSSRFPLLGIMASQASATSPWAKLQFSSLQTVEPVEPTPLTFTP